MQSLDHGAVTGPRELDQPARQRTRDPERVGHAFRVEAKQMATGDGGAEWPGRARRMKAARLVAVLGRPADADHHFGAGDKGSEQLAPAKSALLCQRQRSRQNRCAGMRAGARPGGAVEFERMRERTIGQRGVGSGDRCRAIAQDMAAAALAHAARMGDNDAAPRQAAAEHDRGNGIGKGILGPLDDGRRHVLEPQSRGKFSQPDRLTAHVFPRRRSSTPISGEPSSPRRCLRAPHRCRRSAACFRRRRSD